ncbi:MAG: TIGR00341 family protein [Leptolyngbyaceae cyanobacterium]
MSLRLIEVYLPNEYQPAVESLLSHRSIVHSWYEPYFQDQVWVRILVKSTEAEPVVDEFADKFEAVEDFRLLLLNVETSLPSQTQTDSAEANGQSSNDRSELDPKSARISRGEVYDRIIQSAQLSWVQLAMLVISTIIAAIGIIRDSQAVVIGAMVIAPLLGPNMALAVATTLGDRVLVFRTLRTGAIGILLAFSLSAAFGHFWSVSLDSSEIADRMHIGWQDGILAFASGVAGAIALTTEERSSIVGVMVSVALLPPLVVVGLMVGAAYWSEAIIAGMLTITNLICLNLAAISTFLIQDLRPRQQQDATQARQVTQVAYTIWIILLLGLIGVVLLIRMYDLPVLNSNF